MKNIVDRIINWLWLSSEHPQEVGLTAKSALLTLASGLTFALGFSGFHIPLAPDAFNGLIDATISVIQNVLLLVGSIGTLVGAVRKVWNTVKGNNASVALTSTVQPTN